MSTLQPTPAEEVENAIHEDAAKAEAANGVAGVEATPEDVDAVVQDTPVPMEPPAPEETSSVFAPAAPVRRAASLSAEERSQKIAEPKETIYIGNLFFDVTEDDLKKELGRFGEITNCRLLRDARGLSKGSVPPIRKHLTPY